MRAWVLAAFATLGCGRRAPSLDQLLAEANALSDVTTPQLPSEAVETFACPATRVVIRKDAIHVTNAPAFAWIERDKARALVDAAEEEQRYGYPLLAKNVVTLVSGRPREENGVQRRGVIGALREVLDFARSVAPTITDADGQPDPDGRAHGVEILADRSVPATLIADVAATVASLELRPALRLVSGGGSLCTSFLVPVPHPHTKPHFTVATSAATVSGSGDGARACPLFLGASCTTLASWVRVAATADDPCVPSSGGDDRRFVVLRPEPAVTIGDVLDAFRDVVPGFRKFTLDPLASIYVSGREACSKVREGSALERAISRALGGPLR